jgi:tetratricopeptide (TPR) repeat protein
MFRTGFLLLSVVALGCSNGDRAQQPAAHQKPAREDTAEQAMIAYEKDDHEQAIKYFTQAIARNPSNPAYYCNRGNSYSKLSRFDEAYQDYESAFEKMRALSSNPSDKRLAYIHYNRGVAYRRARRFPEAVADFERAIQINPDYPDAHGECAWIWATHADAELRNPQKAVEYALAEMSRHPDAATIDTLAAAYAANGDFAQAIQRQEEAIQKLTPSDNRVDFEKRLQLYRENKPYIDPAE